MGRAIKFRGRRLDNGEWAYGLLLTNKLGTYIITEDNPHECTQYHYLEICQYFRVDPETVGQLTGLKDRNGNDVYEGDVLKIPDLYETPENTSTQYHYEAVVFDEGSFRSGNSRIPLTDDWEYLGDESEVIGNVWNNPELLESRSATESTE